MNGSQLLYKVSDLQYSIRMKNAEYSKAVKANDQFKMDAYKADLAVLKADLANTQKELENIPPYISPDNTKDLQKKKKWQSFFAFRTVFNKK